MIGAFLLLSLINDENSKAEETAVVHFHWVEFTD